jgi:hypothetical protein
MQTLIQQEIIGQDKRCALVLRQDFGHCKHGRADIGRCSARQWAVGVEVVGRVLGSELDPIEMPAQGDDTVVAVASAILVRLHDAVCRHRQIDVLTVQLICIDRHVNCTRVAVAIERKQTIEALAVFCQRGYRLSFFLGRGFRFVILSQDRSGGARGNRCE